MAAFLPVGGGGPPGGAVPGVGGAASPIVAAHAGVDAGRAVDDHAPVRAGGAGLRAQGGDDGHGHRAGAHHATPTGRQRTRRLGGVLDTLGISADGRVATFAWNTARHLELYFAAPCTGRVLHTLNIRLFPEQLTYIVNHAEDEVIFVDRSLLGLLAPLLQTFERRQAPRADGRRQGRHPRRPERSRAARLRGPAGGRRRRSSSTSTTSTAPRACATRAARRATRRASSTATAARSCTRWRR